MELIEAIKSRMSIRKFKPDPVQDGYINELLEAARMAPSGTNLQPTRYVVIKSEDARAKLKECTPLPFVSEAPVVIAACVDNNVISTLGTRLKELREASAFIGTPLNEDSEDYNKRRSSMDEAALKAYLSLNAAIAIDHITLRAVDLGLGSCWVMMFDKEKLKDMLKLDERFDVIALLPVGYPDQAPAQRPRLTMDEILLKQL